MESRMLTLQLLLLFSVFSPFSILLCCWVLFAPRVTVPPVSDFKFGVGATYRVLSWHLPNPPASTAQWATHFHWCCNILPTKKATLQYYALFPWGLILQAPCTPPGVYHGGSTGERHVYCGTGSTQPTVMLRRKQKQPCKGHTGLWHAVSIGCVKIHKAQEKSQIPSRTWVRTHN